MLVCFPREAGSAMATPTLAYSTVLFPSFYDAMVASLPPQFEVAESHTFYKNLALQSASQAEGAVKILDLCTGTGRIPQSIAKAWASKAGRFRSTLQIIGVDNSEAMLEAAAREWIDIPNGKVEWKLSTLGRRGALAGLKGVDLAFVSAGSFHHLTTREEQLVALTEVKESLKVGGLLVLNLFGVDEIIEEVSFGDHGGSDVWHLKDGFWKQTLEKVVDHLEDGGITGTETFKIGSKNWKEEMTCSWTLRAVWWEDIRELCEEVGLVILQEFRSFHDALEGRSAALEETDEAGRIFVIQRPQNRKDGDDLIKAAATPAVAYKTAEFPTFYNAMVATLPAEFEVVESQSFYSNLALALTASPDTDVDAKILDLCTGTGRIPRCIANAWASKAGKSTLQIIGVDNSEAMLEEASREWIDIPNAKVEWKLGTLGQLGALTGVKGVDLALISAGSFHHLTTREEQLVALAEVKESLKDGGLLVLNLFAVDEIVEEVSFGDHGGSDVWHLKDGFWKQTLEKVVDHLEDGGITGTETFKIGSEQWKDDITCSWTLRAVWWEDIRELCEEVGLVILQEFRSFHDALEGKTAATEETEEAGRIFVIQKPLYRKDGDDLIKAATPTLAYDTALFSSFYDAMVATLPPEFEVLESQTFFSSLALTAAPNSDVDVKILDLCTGAGRVPRCIAAAWSKKARNCRKCGQTRSLQIIGVDNSEEMLKAAKRDWIEARNVDMKWKRGTLGQPGALTGLQDMDLALISDGSFHLLATRKEQVVALAEVKKALKVGGLLILNLFAVDELVDYVSLGDHGGLDIWQMKNGFWKETLNKEVATLEDGGIIGTETFKIGCKEWAEDLVCSWTLRAVWWEDIRELCEEVDLVIHQEFRSFGDALRGRSADVNETGDGGRIFVIQRQS